VRIRFCGFLANRRRGNLLPVCRQLLAAAGPPQDAPAPEAKLPVPGSVPVVAAPWRSSKSSLLSRCSEDLLAGRPSLTPHSCRLSANHPLAPAREPEVCPDAIGRPKTRQNSALQAAPFTVYLESLTSKAATITSTKPKFVAPQAPTSIEHPYPDRVRRKRERPRSNAPI
jgi:hypothetical protein